MSNNPEDSTAKEFLAALYPQLKIHEGRRLKKYFDTEGYTTIGIGFNMDRGGAGKTFKDLGIKDFSLIYSGQKDITEEEAEHLFNVTIDEAILDAVESDVSWYDLTQNRKLVIVDMVFNLGAKGFEKFINTRKMIREADFDGAARNMLYSLWAKQVGLRAYRLSYMMRNDADFDTALEEIG